MNNCQSNLSVLISLVLYILVTTACAQDSTIVKETDQTSDAQSQRETFTIVEAQPSYEGGFESFYQYLIKEIKYPLKARSAEVEGVVKVQFDIERDGSISNIAAIEGIGSGCDQEAITLIKNAKGFKPGAQRGRTIKTSMILPITFKLNKEKTNADGSFQGTIIAGELAVSNKELKVSADYKDGQWLGTVSNTTGDKLPGVNIVVAGTNYGTVSNLSGEFSVKAEQDQELHISCVGYEQVLLKN